MIVLLYYVYDLLSAIQEQYYWAYTMDVCLLAAGYNMPSVGSSGSGIYLGRQGPLTYAMAEERGSFMLQSYVPKKYPFEGTIGYFKPFNLRLL